MPNLSKCKIIISGKSCNIRNPAAYIYFYKNNSQILGGVSQVWTAQSYRYLTYTNARLLTDVAEYANIMAYHEISIDFSLPRATIWINGIRVRGVNDTTNEVVKITNDIFVHNTDGGVDFDRVNINRVCNGMTIKIYR